MTLLVYRIIYRLSYRQQAKVQIRTLLLLSSKSQYLGLIYFFKIFQCVRKSHNDNNNSDNSLTSRRTNGGKTTTRPSKRRLWQSVSLQSHLCTAVPTTRRRGSYGMEKEASKKLELSGRETNYIHLVGILGRPN